VRGKIFLDEQMFIFFAREWSSADAENGGREVKPQLRPRSS
jgi:hypothetical protein